MASFAEMHVAQTASIQQWVTEQINSRTEPAGRAVVFINNFDTKQIEVVGMISEEIGDAWDGHASRGD